MVEREVCNCAEGLPYVPPHFRILIDQETEEGLGVRGTSDRGRNRATEQIKKRLGISGGV
jgi:cell division GTPase FtsZ